MPTTKWLSIDDTHLLMRQWAHGERMEWHPVAQATLRQIYAEVEPMYYVWRREGEDEGVVGKVATLEEAKAMAEVAAGVSSGRSEREPSRPAPSP